MHWAQPSHRKATAWRLVVFVLSAQSPVDAARAVFAVSHLAWQAEEPQESTTAASTLDQDNVWSVAVGRDGSVYMAGYTKAQKGEGWDAFVSKYAWSGQVAWTALHGSQFVDDATCVASGDNGTVLLAGFTEGNLAGQTNNGQQDAFVSQYSAEGAHLWTRLVGTSAREDVAAVSGGIDGSVALAGWSDGGLGTNALPYSTGGKDVFVSKFSRDGGLLWTQALATPWYERARAVAVLDDGSVVVSGYTYGLMVKIPGQEDNSNDVFVAKFSPEGNLSWIRQDITIGVGGTDSSLTALACGGDGSVAIAGFTMVDHFMGQKRLGAVDSLVVMYSPTGDLLWAKLFGSESDDKVWSAVVTSENDVLIAGASRGNLGGKKNHGKWDVFVAMYDKTGDLLWVDLLGTPEDDEARAIGLTGDRMFLVAGFTEGDLNLNGLGRGNFTLSWADNVMISAAAPRPFHCRIIASFIFVAAMIRNGISWGLPF